MPTTRCLVINTQSSGGQFARQRRWEALQCSSVKYRTRRQQRLRSKSAAASTWSSGISRALRSPSSFSLTGYRHTSTPTTRVAFAFSTTRRLRSAASERVTTAGMSAQSSSFNALMTQIQMALGSIWPSQVGFIHINTAGHFMLTYAQCSVLLLFITRRCGYMLYFLLVLMFC